MIILQLIWSNRRYANISATLSVRLDFNSRVYYYKAIGWLCISLSVTVAVDVKQQQRKDVVDEFCWFSGSYFKL